MVMLPKPLEPFAESPECRKCGSHSISAKWWPHISERNDPLHSPPFRRPEEHLLRCCQECGFKWAEKTKDAPPAITCPKCGMTSGNENDIREGYCGNCHEWTSPHKTQ